MFYPNWRLRLLAAFLATLAVFIMIFILVENRLGSAVMSIACSKAQIKGQQILARAAETEVAERGDEYQDLVYIHKDDSGKIVMIQPDIVKMNGLVARTALAVERDLASIEQETIKIPLGQVLGSRLLAGYGPPVKARVVPVGQVRVNLRDVFEAAGINQTRHYIYLDISAILNIAVPFSTENVKVAAQVPVTETIIVGEVPNTYLHLASKGVVTTPLPSEIRQELRRDK